MSHPGDLSSKTLDVILLSLQDILGDEEGKGTVLHTDLLNVRVEPLLDFLPNAVRSGLSESR